MQRVLDTASNYRRACTCQPPLRQCYERVRPPDRALSRPYSRAPRSSMIGLVRRPGDRTGGRRHDNADWTARRPGGELRCARPATRPDCNASPGQLSGL